ncbi:unnamed protein product [Protopolystoma xenopodis]|uniref:Uncharacterized protein n=1 Tax=Protopolystoma xenopodis TaxID=117903 RepID=A0A3S5BAM8_9PLAT|nr:unnamed protein product [Protopolystoma xenopodis]
MIPAKRAAYTLKQYIFDTSGAFWSHSRQDISFGLHTFRWISRTKVATLIGETRSYGVHPVWRLLHFGANDAHSSGTPNGLMASALLLLPAPSNTFQQLPAPCSLPCGPICLNDPAAASASWTYSAHEGPFVTGVTIDFYKIWAIVFLHFFMHQMSR